MAWVLLVLSGILEAVWAVALGESCGLRRRRPTAVFVIALIASLVGLALAMGDLPTGTAYAVWVASVLRSPCCGRSSAAGRPRPPGVCWCWPCSSAR